MARNDISAFVLGPKGFAFAFDVVSHHRAGHLQDVLCGPVVLFKSDDARARKVLFKSQDVLDIGAAELIDGLILIPDNKEILVLARSGAGAARTEACWRPGTRRPEYSGTNRCSRHSDLGIGPGDRPPSGADHRNRGHWTAGASRCNANIRPPESSAVFE